MSKFLKVQLFKTSDKFNPLNTLAALEHDKYTVNQSRHFLIKSKVADSDDLEDAFLLNALITDFDIYAYATNVNWLSDSVREILPFITKSFDKNAMEVIDLPLALHCVTTSSDENSQQSLTQFVKIKYENDNYLVVTTIHSPLRLAINSLQVVVYPDDYSYNDYIINKSLGKLLSKLELRATKTYEIDKVDEESLEVQYKIIENIILYEHKKNASRIYNAVLPLFPNTVISDVAAVDEMVNIQDFDCYEITEQDIENNHVTVDREDIVLAILEDDFNNSDLHPDDFLSRSIAIAVHDSDINPNSLFRQLNGFWFDHGAKTDVATIIDQAKNHIKAHRKEPITNRVIRIGDVLIDVDRLPEWQIFLLIPYIRIQILNGLDLDDPELDLVEGFLAYVGAQLTTS